MTDPRTLLTDYAANGSESAFRERVERYLNLVHSTALPWSGRDTCSTSWVGVRTRSWPTREPWTTTWTSDQYGIVLSREYVQERIETPFQRVEHLEQD